MTEFNAPATAQGIQWGDLNGSLLLFDAHSLETGINTIHGVAKAIKADVTVLDGDYIGTFYKDTLVFPKVLINQIRPSIGAKVLGRLGQGHAKPEQSPPWIIADATEQDRETAREFLENVTSEVPF